MGGACSTFGRKERYIQDFEGKRPHGRPRCRWEGMKLDIQVGGWGASTGQMWLRIGAGGGLL